MCSRVGSQDSPAAIVPNCTKSSELTLFNLDFRHTCEQNEGMAGYGWDEYDIRKGGRQTIHDAGNTLDLTIEFVKVPTGQHGGSWGARVKGVPREDAPAEQVTTVVFYTTLEGSGSLGVASEEADSRGFESDVKFAGHTPDLGDFSIDVTAGPESNGHPFHSHPTYEDKPLDRTLVSSETFPPENLWQSKGTFNILNSSMMYHWMGLAELNRV